MTCQLQLIFFQYQLPVYVMAPMRHFYLGLIKAGRIFQAKEWIMVH